LLFIQALFKLSDEALTSKLLSMSNSNNGSSTQGGEGDGGHGGGGAANSEDEGHYVVRCRGLPWSTTTDEIVKFFDGVEIENGDITAINCSYKGFVQALTVCT